MTEVPWKLATAAQVAERLNTSPRTIRRYADAGVLPAVRVGHLLRFDPKDVDAVIAAGRRR